MHVNVHVSEIFLRAPVGFQGSYRLGLFMGYDVSLPRDPVLPPEQLSLLSALMVQSSSSVSSPGALISLNLTPTTAFHLLLGFII